MRSRWLVVLAVVALAASGCERAAPVASGEGFIDVPGGPVWYRVVGAGRHTPLLLVHGGPGGDSCVMSALGELGGERPVVFYDQLGSGRSRRPTDLSLFRLDRFVEELDTVRRRLGLTRVHLLGHSWGGALVLEYVLRKGTAGVESLVLAGPLVSTRDWVADADVLRRALPPEVQAALLRHEAAGTTTSAEYLDARAEYYARYLYHHPKPPIPACTGRGWNQVVYELMWGATELTCTGTLRDFDVTARLAEIHVPVLLMVGEFDELRAETARRYARLLPRAQVAVIEDAGHMSMVDQPEKVKAVVRGFLAEVEGP